MKVLKPDDVAHADRPHHSHLQYRARPASRSISGQIHVLCGYERCTSRSPRSGLTACSPGQVRAIWERARCRVRARVLGATDTRQQVRAAGRKSAAWGPRSTLCHREPAYSGRQRIAQGKSAQPWGPRSTLCTRARVSGRQRIARASPRRPGDRDTRYAREPEYWGDSVAQASRATWGPRSTLCTDEPAYWGEAYRPGIPRTWDAITLYRDARTRGRQC